MCSPCADNKENKVLFAAKSTTEFEYFKFFLEIGKLLFLHFSRFRYNHGMQKVILVDIVPLGTQAEEYEDRMVELENLVSTYGSLVVLKKIQKRYAPDYNTYV